MHKRSVAINTIVQLIGKVFSLGVNVLIVYFLTHHYSLTEYGEYTAVFAYLTIFNVLADLGLSTILVRDIPEYKPDKQPLFIGNLIILRTISLVISLGLGIIIAQFIPQYNHIIKIGIIIGSLSTFALLLSFLLFSIFQVQLKLQRSVYANAVGVTINLLLVLLFIKLNFSIQYAVLALSLGYVAMLLVSMYFTWKTQQIRFLVDITLWKKILPQCFIIGAAVVFSSIYFKSDSLILSVMKPYTVVSLYGVPYKILEVLIALPQMFMAPVFAIMANVVKEDSLDRFKNLFQRSFDLLLLGGLPIIPGALFLSRKVILLYAGSKYMPSVDLLKILSIAVFISFLGSSFIYVVLLFKQQRYLLIWNIFLSLFNITLNILFIPRYSYYASAWLTVATEALVFAGSFFFVYKTIAFSPTWHMLPKGIIATACFTLILYVLSGTNLFIQIILAIFTYAITLIAVKAITLAELKEMIKR